MRCWHSGARSSSDRSLKDSPRAWLGLAALLAAVALAGAHLDASRLDWQPARTLDEPWRALTAIAVHYSPRHLGVNLAGTALVAALGWSARVPAAMAGAWACAWPLTQLGLALRPDLQHYGGLSGVLHAGVAVIAVHLSLVGGGARRALGAALGAGLVLKVLLEAPWGPPLRHPSGWDIATAPLGHASGLAAGIACALIAHALRRRRAGMTPAP